MPEASVGVIGGSGLYDIEALTDIESVAIDTPFGSPSDTITVGTLDGVRVAFLPRHGKGHRISPSELPSQANVWAMKSLGVTHLISVSAVGSLREELEPRHVVIPDQLLDRTKGVRPASFFGNDIVVHIAFAEPYCPELRRVMVQAATEAGATVHDGGTMVVMEGPQFSTRAESNFYRQIGGDLIGMTALPEAKLAREAEMHYCTVAMVTDYDCWRETEECVTVDMVVANMQANVGTSKAILRTAIPRIAALAQECACDSALADAFITQRDAIPPERIEELRLIVGKYLT
ncbi:MAG TPA: S-methyl-5'-thioadenosine phosphorylase [Chloroflexi bacterium]|jgi:5'-methylthioadenosine phosphorylase|nr:S-methyl-5'-thioadenosine phosphorylase [Chloroflexota bacterium]